MYNPFSLNGKTILITGASSGIGKITSIECSKLGAKIILTGRNTKRLEETLALLSGEGHQLKVLDLNISEAVSEFIENMPKLDGVVYCAGTQRTCPAKYIQRQDLDEVFEINFFAC